MVWSLTDHTYQIGELFVNTNTEEASALMEKAKTTVQDEINKLQSQMEGLKNILSDLKVQLYAKFGSNINLEAEEDWWQRPECVLCARGVQILNEYFGRWFFFLTHFPQLLRFMSSGESEQMMTDSCIRLRWLIFIAS